MKIYNSLTGTKEVFVPIQPGTVRIYGCGVTPYKLPHLGHAMQSVFFDIFRRYFEYKGYKVTYVRNYTDVDDKIIKIALENGIHPLEHSSTIMRQSDIDFDRLRIKRADHEPKVSENIEEIIEFVQDLIRKGFAYNTDQGNVYFRVNRYTEYGKLSKQNISALKKGTRKHVEFDKEDPLDFALWKSEDKSEILWNSPWGVGRPGWHIECSVMAKRHLGEHFDIHGGGRDLIFPHHENEIAQSESAHNGKFVNYWVHNGLLMVGKAKMSKSLNNDTSIREWLEKFHPEVIRYMIISNHYRSNVQFNENRYHEANKRVYSIYQTLNRISVIKMNNIEPELLSELINEFEHYMDDDLNTVRVIAMINRLETEINKASNQKTISTIHKVLSKITPVIGLFDLEPHDVIQSIEDLHLQQHDVTREDLNDLMQRRNQYRKDKQYQLADKVRDQFTDLGLIILDTAETSSWQLGV